MLNFPENLGWLNTRISILCESHNNKLHIKLNRFSSIISQFRTTCTLLQTLVLSVTMATKHTRVETVSLTTVTPVAVITDMLDVPRWPVYEVCNIL